MCGFFHLVGSVLQAAFVGLLVWGFLLLGRRMAAGSRRRADDPVRRSLALLNERYARGSIDRDEYLERRAYLE